MSVGYSAGLPWWPLGRFLLGLVHWIFSGFFPQKFSFEGVRVFSSPLNDYGIVVVLATQSCPTLPPQELQPTRLLCPWGQEHRRRNSHSCAESQEEVQKVPESVLFKKKKKKKCIVSDLKKGLGKNSNTQNCYKRLNQCLEVILTFLTSLLFLEHTQKVPGGKLILTLL